VPLQLPGDVTARHQTPWKPLRCRFIFHSIFINLPPVAFFFSSPSFNH
jgi:hypothetical protein